MKLYVFLALLCTALAATNFEKQCGQKPVATTIKPGTPWWWFNMETGKCERFYYGGSADNENQYLTQEKCEETCLTGKPVCRKPPHPGPCLGSFHRFYYDQETNSCRPFIYGGCNSNGNNFESPVDCMQFCGYKKPGEPMLRVA
nr:kunitz-type serine protease inhibitor 6-like [Dermacentor andersoni]